MVQAAEEVDLIPKGFQNPLLRFLLGDAAHHEGLARKPVVTGGVA